MRMVKTAWRDGSRAGMAAGDFGPEECFEPVEVLASEEVPAQGSRPAHWRYKLRFRRRPTEANYNAYVVGKVRLRYAVDQEIALLRQREEKPEEFAEYNAYVEACKAEARKALGME